jgi:hypothetical protein
MRDVFIIARGEPDLYEYLTRHFADRPDVEVILDRRTAERRRRNVTPLTERRCCGRRARSVEGDLAALGFAVVMGR